MLLIPLIDGVVGTSELSETRGRAAESDSEAAMVVENINTNSHDYRNTFSFFRIIIIIFYFL